MIHVPQALTIHSGNDAHLAAAASMEQNMCGQAQALNKTAPGDRGGTKGSFHKGEGLMLEDDLSHFKGTI
jgi:D-alanyl-D-alanine carboxypeptidase